MSYTELARRFCAREGRVEMFGAMSATRHLRGQVYVPFELISASVKFDDIGNITYAFQ